MVLTRLAVIGAMKDGGPMRQVLVPCVLDRPLELFGHELPVLVRLPMPDPLRIELKLAARRVVQHVMIEA